MSVRARVLRGMFVAAISGACSSADAPDVTTPPPSPTVSPATVVVGDAATRVTVIEPRTGPEAVAGVDPDAERLLAATSQAPRCLEAEAAVQTLVAERLAPLPPDADADAATAHELDRLRLIYEGARPFLPPEVERLVAHAEQMLVGMADAVRGGATVTEAMPGPEEYAMTSVAVVANIGAWIAQDCPEDWPDDA